MAVPKPPRPVEPGGPDEHWEIEHPCELPPGKQFKGRFGRNIWPRIARTHQSTFDRSDDTLTKLTALNSIISGYAVNADCGRSQTLQWLRKKYREEKGKRGEAGNDSLMEANLLRSIASLGVLRHNRENVPLIVEAIDHPGTPAIVLTQCLHGLDDAQVLDRKLVTDPKLWKSIKSLIHRPISIDEDVDVLVATLERLYTGTNPITEGFPINGTLLLAHDFLEEDDLYRGTIELLAESDPSLVQTLASGILIKSKLTTLLKSIGSDEAINKKIYEQAEPLINELDIGFFAYLGYKSGHQETAISLPSKQLTPSDMQVLDKMLDVAETPSVVLAKLFTDNRADVVSVGPPSFSLNALGDEIVYLARNAGLTHVALQLPESTKPLISAIVNEGFCACSLNGDLAGNGAYDILLSSGHLGDALAKLGQPNASRNEIMAECSSQLTEVFGKRTDELGDFLRKIGREVEFIFYKPDDYAHLGDLEVDAQAMKITPSLERGKTLVLGKEIYLGRQDLIDPNQRHARRSLMRRLREDLDPGSRRDRTATVLVVGPVTKGKIRSDTHCHNGCCRLGTDFAMPTSLREWLTNAQLKRDVALPIKGTPLAELQFLTQFPNKLEDLFDVLVIRSGKSGLGDTRVNGQPVDIRPEGVPAPARDFELVGV